MVASAKISVSLTPATVRQQGGRINAKDLPGVRRSMTRRTKRVAALARATAPTQTGRLKRSIKSTMKGSTGEVSVGGPGVPYASPVIFGARPHIIRPKKKGGMLRFETGGRVVFARQVSHPGNRPNMFLVRALRAAKE